MKRKNNKFNKRPQNPLNKLSLFQNQILDFQKNVLFQEKMLQSSIIKMLNYLKDMFQILIK